MLTRVLALEMAKHNICVNAIAPGWVKTELNELIWSDSKILEQVNAEKNIESIRQQNLSAVVKRYSWQNLCPIYDESFVRLKK